MADPIILTLHLRADDGDDVPELLREAAETAEDDGMESRAIQVVGKGYSYRLERHDERHELSERADDLRATSDADLLAECQRRGWGVTHG